MLTGKEDYDGALLLLDDYQKKLKEEIVFSYEAIDYVKNELKEKEEKKEFFSREEASSLLNVTKETIRTWERNGLLNPKKDSTAHPVYSLHEIKRLKVIKALRNSNYSIMAILRMLEALNESMEISIMDSLDTPSSKEEIISVCDTLITSLKKTLEDSYLWEKAIKKMKEKYLTLQ